MQIAKDVKKYTIDWQTDKVSKGAKIRNRYN